MSNIFTDTIIPPSVVNVPEVTTLDDRGKPYTHQIEVELISDTPRQAHLTPRTLKLRRWLWNILISMFCVLFFFARRDIENWDALIQRGVPIIGKVYGKHIGTTKNNTFYYIDYAFEADQHYCYGSYMTSYNDYHSPLNNSPVTVTYLPGSAGEIWQLGVTTQPQRDDRLAKWAWVTLSIALSSGLVIVCCNANWKNQLQAIQNGIAVTGVVTAGKVVAVSQTEKYYFMTYQYSVGARLIKKRIMVSEQHYYRYALGNPYISVLYHLKNPKKSLAYFQIKNAQLSSLAVSACVRE